jgi:hypothetical protein
MKKHRLFTVTVLLFFIALNSYSQSLNVDSILQRLDEVILLRKEIDQVKLNKIENFRVKFQQTPIGNKNEKWMLAETLYNEYKSFSYDSAFQYAMKLNILSRSPDDIQKISAAKIDFGFIFLSSGLFKEAIDTLLSVEPANLEKELKIAYYGMLGRTYHDLADYEASSYYTSVYNHTGNRYLEKALELIPEYSFTHYMYRGAEQLKAGQFESARETFTRLHNNSTMTEHQRAITTSTLGYIYTCLDKPDKAIYYLGIAAIADIQSSTKETVALRNLAHLINDKGMTDRAYRYIKIALEDADYYNARHRKKEVGNVLPIIEGKQLSKIESQKELLVRYLVAISALGFIAFILLVVSSLQFFKLKRAKELLQVFNSTLADTNKKLSESNQIKEKYLGYYFNINATYLERIEKVQKILHHKIISKQYNDMLDVLKKELNAEKELDELISKFDRIFLSLFPNFVHEFNKLFLPEDQIILKETEFLDKELRIFALMRMGITDIEKIAKILNYSVNTIYTYKTKIKNRSIVSNNDFEERVMQIDA